MSKQGSGERSRRAERAREIRVQPGPTRLGPKSKVVVVEGPNRMGRSVGSGCSRNGDRPRRREEGRFANRPILRFAIRPSRRKRCIEASMSEQKSVSVGRRDAECRAAQVGFGVGRLDHVGAVAESDLGSTCYQPKLSWNASCLHSVGQRDDGGVQSRKGSRF